jgi:hypothetical protein
MFVTKRILSGFRGRLRGPGTPTGTDGPSARPGPSDHSVRPGPSDNAATLSDHAPTPFGPASSECGT